MYTRPILYKIYSVIIIVVAGVSFLSSIIALFTFDAAVKKLPFIGESNLMAVYLVIKICLVLLALVSLFFAYMDFSSMFTFADMIQYERSSKDEIFKKRAFVLPAKFYSQFGKVITYISFVISLISIIVLIISYSVIHGAFLAIPIIRLIPIILGCVLVYITYYARYKAFGDLLNLLSRRNPDAYTLSEIKENKTTLLRGYCTFLYITAFLTLAILLVLGIVFARTLSGVLGIGGTIFVYVLAFLGYLVYFLELAIIGCYFDNLAKMVEHYMIKYKLL